MVLSKIQISAHSLKACMYSLVWEKAMLAVVGLRKECFLGNKLIFFLTES